MIGIYKITSPSNRIYIGQSWDINKRFSQYSRCSCYKQRKLYSSLKKYGAINHKFEVVYEFPNDVTQEMLDTYETFYWQQYKDCGFRMLNLKTPGGGGKHSQESIQRMKANAHLLGKKGPLHPAFGKKQTKEHIEKIQKNRRGKNHPMYGRKQSEKFLLSKRKKVINLDTGEIYLSCKIASETIGIGYPYLVAMLNGRNPNKTNLQYTN